MEPTDILALAAFTGVVSVRLTQAVTEFYKAKFPNGDPQLFSVITGALLTVVTWLATTPLPSSLQEWAADSYLKRSR